jgi:hypothetical protein
VSILSFSPPCQNLFTFHFHSLLVPPERRAEMPGQECQSTSRQGLGLVPVLPDRARPLQMYVRTPASISALADRVWLSGALEMDALLPDEASRVVPGGK